MKKPTDLETRILEFLDNNIRIIQYSVYAIGLVGLTYIAKSTYAFKRFTSARDLPREFIKKAVKLQGKVSGIEYLQLPVSEDGLHFAVRLNIDHIPVANLWLKEQKEKLVSTSTLKVELVGVRSTLEGLEKWIKPQLQANPTVWFRLYGVDCDSNLLYASIILQRAWWMFWKPKDLSLNVLKNNAGIVSPKLSSQHVYLNDKYPAYYRKLLYCELKYRK